MHSHLPILLFSVITLAAAIQRPLFYVPGLGISKLQAHVSNSVSELPAHCARGNVTAWINVLNYLFSAKEECTYVYLNQLRELQYASPDGILIDTMDFGLPSSTIASIGGASAAPSTSLLFQYLEQLGYVAGSSYFVIPFDWRYCPQYLVEHDHAGVISKWKSLVESSYELHNGTAVVLLGYSKGSNLVVSFLQNMTQEWKDKYVHAAILVAGNFVGAPAFMNQASFGSRYIVPFFLSHTEWNTKLYRNMEASVCGVANPNYFAKHVLFTVGNQNYTVMHSGQLLVNQSRAEFEPWYKEWQRTDAMLARNPNVTIYNIFGSHIPTEVAYKWHNADAQSIKRHHKK